jgi:thiol peroxidase
MHRSRPARLPAHLVAAALAASVSGCCATTAATALPERAGLVTQRGVPVVLVGAPVAVGDTAPDFTVVANDMSERKLSYWRGTVVILSTIPSVDTPVCDRETRTFNERVAELGDGAVCLTVSRDLPFAQKRWCGANGIERVVTLSDHRHLEVGARYGVAIQSTGLLARAVFVIDADGVVRHQEIVPELATEPDYEAALAAARAALAG